jgi:hypothetical protein
VAIVFDAEKQKGKKEIRRKEEKKIAIRAGETEGRKESVREHYSI